MVPGSVANLGGGFDTLGVAVQMYLRARIVDVRDDGGARLTVARSMPPVTGGNAVERAFDQSPSAPDAGRPRSTVEVESDIPMAAGLGSSAAATVAGLRVFEHVTGPLDDSELLGAATKARRACRQRGAGALRRPELGDRGRAAHLRTRCDGRGREDLRLVVATPVVGLATAKARAALPRRCSRADAIFNMQRVLALVHALQQGDYDRLREAVQDRWHQPARASLVPLLAEVLALEDPDVLGAFLSAPARRLRCSHEQATRRSRRDCHRCMSEPE